MTVYKMKDFIIWYSTCEYIHCSLHDVNLTLVWLLIVVADGFRVQTPAYVPKKTRWVFWVHPPKKPTTKNPHFYFIIIIIIINEKI